MSEIDNHKISLILTVQQANALLVALGNQPYGTVASLIALIHPQAQRQVDEYLAANPPPNEEEAT